jgi:diguanylate cyclase (GGDEF)-like protein
MYGHEAGDLVLRQISQLITNNIRENDIACRYGGEEFIIILPNTDSETAAQRADLLCQSTARLELSMNGNDLGKITISVGVATHPLHGQTRDSLIRSADEALYTAKQNGRNQVVLRGT